MKAQKQKEVKRMQYSLTEEQELLKETVRRLAKEKVEPGTMERDEKGVFDWDMVNLLRENDLFGLDWYFFQTGRHVHEHRSGASTAL